MKLSSALTDKERKKGKHHKVFEVSSDIKRRHTDKMIEQKLKYMHLNPVSKKWSLVTDYFLYPHSSARFYEAQQPLSVLITHYKDLG